MNTIKLPSAFQVGDYCYLRTGNRSHLHSEVTAVKFTHGKVLYDITVSIDLPSIEVDFDGKSEKTRIHGVDSAFVITVDQYDQWRTATDWQSVHPMDYLFDYGQNEKAGPMDRFYFGFGDNADGLFGFGSTIEYAAVDFLNKFRDQKDFTIKRN